MKVLISLASAVLLSAQTATAPVAAIVLNGDGQLLSVTGVLQSLLPGVPFGSYGRVVAASFGRSGGAVKSDSQLLVLDATGHVQSQFSADPGIALFGMGPDGNVAWVYFAESSQIQSLDGTVAFSGHALGDEIVALGAATAAGLTVLVRSGTQLWAETLDASTGAILNQTPVNGSAPGVWFEGGWLTSGTAVSGKPALLWGTQTLPAPALVTTLQTAGPHSVAINGIWLMNSAWKILEIPATRRAGNRSETIPPVGVRH